MAIQHDNHRTIQVSDETRTHQVTINAPKGAAPLVHFHRERLEITADGEVLRRVEAQTVGRVMAGALLTETVTLADGRVVSVADIAQAIAALGDRWHTEDIAAAAAEKAQREAEAAALAAKQAELAELRAAKTEPPPPGGQ